MRQKFLDKINNNLTEDTMLRLQNLSDEETLQTISENPYMQFFLDCNTFCPDILFSPTVFVDIRKRLGNEIFNQFSDELIKICFPKKIANEKVNGNKGELKLDATVADQYIQYPNDLGLLNDAREKTELGVKKTVFNYLPHLKADRKNNQLTKNLRAEKKTEDGIKLKVRLDKLSKGSALTV